MTYLIERSSKEPASAFRIIVDDPEPGSEDAGFARGGSYLLAPGDPPIQVGEAAAAAIMGDPDLKKHFKSTPPWKPKTERAEKAAGGTEKAKGHK